MDQNRSPARPGRAAFEPVPLRYRHDGWTPERQVAFIDALAECGCVVEACRRVGMSTESAYTLARRVEAQSFRLAWQGALDYAVRRLEDSCISRAINGVAVPHFYQGQQVGEHRRYNDRLAMFILRYRWPDRYRRALDRVDYGESAEAAALKLSAHRDQVINEAVREDLGEGRTYFDAIPGPEDGPEFAARHRKLVRPCAEEEWEEDWDEEEVPEEAGAPWKGAPPPDVPPTSSTSAPPDAPPDPPSPDWEPLPARVGYSVESQSQEAAMSKNQHNHDSMQFTQNQNNEMSDDPGDGSRNSETLGRTGGATAAEKPPENDAQDESTIEAFGEEGAGIAAKE